MSAANKRPLFDTIQVAEAARVLTALRQKLLDLSNRNRLLNFNHSPKARGHVRIVDEVPAFLYGELARGKEFSFKPLPEPDEDEGIPEDEKTDEFETAYDRAQVEDKDYLNRCAKIDRQFASDEDDEGYTRAMARADRELRDRLRERLHLPPRDLAAADPVSIARANDIEPTYDLSKPSKEAFKPSQLDRYMQTLLFPDELERKLGGVFETAMHSINEKGVNTLYVAFGFLEWFESEDSDNPMFAPLILVPAEMEKRVEEGEIEYTIRAIGEEPQSNITLAARLKQDFGLILPDLNEDENPEDYLGRIGELVEGRDRWRVRRFVTIGHFAFARLVMYNDLNELNWPSERKPSAHGVARRLFGGGESQGATGFREVYDPDSPANVLLRLPLVVDADSSQFSAILDAMQGYNLVIQGPPGTGKSQTITNLIAAAISAGHSVLFVAEKMAALNVVMSRLESVGLGPYCLELHSTKAKKGAVIDALRKRLEMVPPQSNAKRGALAAEELADAKHSLKHYLGLLQRELGDTQCKISQVLWRAHLKPETELPEALRSIAIPGIETWGPSKLGRIQQYLTALAGAEEGLGTPSACPWGWLHSATLTPVDFPKILHRVTEMENLAVELGRGVSELSGIVNVALPSTCAELLPMTDLWAGLPLPDHGEDARAFEAMSDAVTAEDVRQLGRLDVRLARLDFQLGIWFPPGVVPTEADVVWLRETPGRLPSDTSIETLADLDRERQLLESSADDVEQVSELIDDLARILRATGVARTASTVDAICELIRVLEETPQAVFEDRTAARVSTDARAKFESLQMARYALEQDTVRLTSRLRFNPQTVDADVVCMHRIALERNGFMGWLFSDFRAARRFAMALYDEGKCPAKSEVLVDLATIETFARKWDSYFSAPDFVAMFGKLANRYDTDFERVERVIAWADSLRRNLGNSPFGHAAVRVLTEESTGEIDRLRGQLGGPVPGLVRHAAKGLRPHLDSMETSPAALRGLAASLGDILKTAETLGIQGLQPLNEFPAMADACAEWIAASKARIETAAKIGRAFGTSVGLAERIERVSAARDAIRNSSLPPLLKMSFLDSSGLQLLRHSKSEMERFSGLINGLRDLGAELASRGSIDDLAWRSSDLEMLSMHLRSARENPAVLPHWCSWVRIRKSLRSEGVAVFDPVIQDGMPAATISAHFYHVAYRAMALRAHEIHPELRHFTGVTLSEAQERIRRIDAQMKDFAREEVLSNAWTRGKKAPPGNGYGPVKTYTELALVLQECSKKKRHIPIRDLLDRSGSAIQSLKPCFMMSPMSVAQYLRSDGLTFDLVIFDEASQVVPEDAIGAVVRGDRLIVVGDQMQLPPTDFFQRSESESVDDFDEEEAAAIQGLESILDKAASVFQPARRLLWHYRSKDPRLIAFSNREFYENKLNLFPAADHANPKSGVKLVEVGGMYAGRCNIREAQAAAEAAVEFMRRYPERSLGLVALNSQQRDLIAAKVDRLIASDPKAADYVQRYSAGLEPFFVKNLENVQGDERDVIFISTVFGPDRDAKKVHQRFGPLNSAVGHRRLNVLFTRAKESVVIFTSLKPEDILVDEESTPRGRKVLRDYLEYARTGRLDAGSFTGREPDSEFEQLVWERLNLEGYKADCQVGVAGYFVDLAVRHPARESHYVLGVECDGATYHSFKSARDRDRLRQEILENLGWKIHRIWSTDWFQNPEREMRRLIERLKAEEKSLKFDADDHIDYSKFASLPEEAPRPKRRLRVRKARQLNMPFDRKGPDVAERVRVPSEEIDTYINDMRERADGAIVGAFRESLEFSREEPVPVRIESSRLGRHRDLELEELYVREVFRWSRVNKGQSLSRMPWATNLSVAENFRLREFALSALTKSGYLP